MHDSWFGNLGLNLICGWVAGQEAGPPAREGGRGYLQEVRDGPADGQHTARHTAECGYECFPY